MKTEQPKKRGRGRPRTKKPEEVKRHYTGFRVDEKEFEAIKICAEAVEAKDVSSFIRGCFIMGVLSHSMGQMLQKPENQIEYQRILKHLDPLKHHEK